MLEFNSEQSNLSVLKKVLSELEEGIEPWILIIALRNFLASKEHIETELDRLTIAARGGDREAARELIVKLAEMNDG